MPKTQFCHRGHARVPENIQTIERCRICNTEGVRACRERKARQAAELRAARTNPS